jgi:hypothetical protein
MFRHQLAVLPAVDSELLALGIVGGEAEEGPAAAGGGTAAAAAPAAAVCNSYVDNLGKSGVKEVGAPPCAPSFPLHVLLVVLYCQNARPDCPSNMRAMCVHAQQGRFRLLAPVHLSRYPRPCPLPSPHPCWAGA